MACCCEQPGFGVLRQAVSWPGLERGNERFAEGILSARQVVRVDGKIRHQTAVGFSGHALYGPPYGALDVLPTAFIHPVNPRRMASGASGRTSTAPGVHRMNKGSREDIQSAVGRTIERVARESYGRLVAYLSVHTHDLASAEDALSEALVSALKAWPRDGLPQNPEAWLLTTARHSLIDVIRHQ